MSNLILYKQRLNLENATFVRIEHEDALVAIVYKVTLPIGKQLILKICADKHHYDRECYFLNYFADKLLVPRIVQTVAPEVAINGALLIECLPGSVLKPADVTDILAHQMGSLLARIHMNRPQGYGDLTKPHTLVSDPRIPFTDKFNESISECINHFPKTVLDQCHAYFQAHVDLLLAVDGPCIIHRDFRPGNIVAYDGQVQGIIDWSSAQAGFAEEDFCSIEHGEWAINFANKESFFDGYKTIRPISDYHAIIPLLRLNKAIATIGFLVKRGTWNNTSADLYQSNLRLLESFF